MEMTIYPKVVIVLAKCSQNQECFGIRFEEKQFSKSRFLFSLSRNNGTGWIGDWAFKIREDSARREGYDSGEIRGTFNFDFGYPGCPHCNGRSIFKCNCGKVACWDLKSNSIKCPWCGSAGELVGQIESLNAGEDR